MRLKYSDGSFENSDYYSVSSLCEKLTSFYIFAMMSIFLLWTGFNGYSDITRSKYAIFLILTAFYGTGVILANLISITLTKRRPERYNMTFAEKLAVILVFLYIISAALSEFSKGKTVWIGAGRYDGVLTAALYAVIFLGTASYGRLRKAHIYAFAAVMIINSFIITLQIFGKNPLELYPEGLCFHDRYIEYNGEFLGTIGNSDLMSALLSIEIPLFMCWYVFEKGRGRFVALAGFACSFWSLLLSEVAGGLLAVCAASFIAIPLFAGKKRSIKKLFAAFAVAAAVGSIYCCFDYDYIGGELSISFLPGKKVLIFVFIAVFSALIGHLLGRFKIGEKPILVMQIIIVAAALICVYFWRGSSGTIWELSRLLHGELSDTFGSGRIAIWKESLELIKEKPLLGGGPDTYGLRSEHVFSRTLASGRVLRSKVDVAHNEYLNMWVNTGILSLFIYLAMLVYSCVSAVKKRTEMSILLLVPILAYAIQAFFGISQFIVTPMFWLLMGLLQKEIKKQATS